MRRSLLFMLALVLSLVLAACGGDDGADLDVGESGTNGEEMPSDGDDNAADDGAAGGEGSVTVVIDRTTHEFSGANCVVNANNTFLDFSDGDDSGSITSAGDVTLIRLVVDGAEYVDMGSAEPPEESGSTHTWSGEMSEAGAGTVNVEITFDC